MFNRELHRRLDDETVEDVALPLLGGDVRQLDALIAQKGMDRDEGLRYLLAAGARVVGGWGPPDKLPG